MSGVLVKSGRTPLVRIGEATAAFLLVAAGALATVVLVPFLVLLVFLLEAPIHSLIILLLLLL